MKKRHTGLKPPPGLNTNENIIPVSSNQSSDPSATFGGIRPSCSFEFEDRTYFIEAKKLFKEQINNQERSVVLGKGAYGIVNEVTISSAEENSASRKSIRAAIKRITVGNDSKKNKYTYKDMEITRLADSHGCELVVKYFGTMIYEQQLWIVMERMDTTLKLFNGCAQKQLDYTVTKRVPYAFIQKLTYSLIEGLYFLKENLKVIHRDIKPSNVLISKLACSIKLCDFGIAADVNNSKRTQGIGSCPYMSPERLKYDSRKSAPFLPAAREGLVLPQTAEIDRNKAYDDRADVWSVGMTLIESLIGEYPYGKDVWKMPPVTMQGHILHSVSPQISHDKRLSKWIDFYCKNERSGSSSEDEQMNGSTDNLEKAAPTTMKSDSFPTYDADRNEAWHHCVKFTDECVIKQIQFEPNSSDQDLDQKAVRPDYDGLKKLPYWRDITVNKWDGAQLVKFFEEVFRELPKYMESRKTVSRSLY